MSELLEREIRTLRAQFWSERDPDGRAFAPLADAYLRKGDLEEAGELLEDGLGRHPDFASGHLVAARVHRARGDEEASLRSVERLLELDGDNASGHRLRGELLEAGGDAAGAGEAFRRAVELDRDFEDLEGRIARLQAGAGGTTVAGDPHPTLPEPGSTSPDEAPDPAIDDPGFAIDDPGFALDDASASPDPPSSPRDDPPSPHDGAAVTDADPDLPEEEGFPEMDAAEKLLFDDVGRETPEDDAAPQAAAEDAAPEPAEPDLSGEDPQPSEELLDFDFSVDEVPEDDLEVGSVPDPNYGLPGAAVPESDASPEATDAGAGDAGAGDAKAGDAEAGDELPTVTRTLGELYVQQGLIVRAIGVYERLLQRDPGNEELARRLDEIKAQLGGGAREARLGAPGVEEPRPPGLEVDEDDAEGFAPQWAREDVTPGDAPVTTPFAWVPEVGEEEDVGGEEGSAGRTIHGYFEDLLAWVPGAVPVESLAPDPSTDAPASETLPDPSTTSAASDPPPAGPTETPSGPSAGEGGLGDLQDWLRDLGR